MFIPRRIASIQRVCLVLALEKAALNSDPHKTYLQCLGVQPKIQGKIPDWICGEDELNLCFV